MHAAEIKSSPVRCHQHSQWRQRSEDPTPAIGWSWRKGCRPEDCGKCRCESAADPSSSKGAAAARHTTRSHPFTEQHGVYTRDHTGVRRKRPKAHRQTERGYCAVNSENPPFLTQRDEGRGTTRRHWSRDDTEQTERLWKADLLWARSQPPPRCCLCVLLTGWHSSAPPDPTGYKWGRGSRSRSRCEPLTQSDTSPCLCDRTAAVRTNGVSLGLRHFTVGQTQSTPTCRSVMWLSLSLLSDTSHTHTTVLVPAVTMVEGLGQAAHSVSPQSDRLSHTANVWQMDRRGHTTFQMIL